MASESAIQKHIMAALRERGVYVFHALAADAGTPDLIACHAGQFYGLECKTDKGRVSKIQQHRLSQIEAAGGVAAVVRSVDDALFALGLYNVHHE